MKNAVNVQTIFLNELRKNKEQVNVFLSSGVKLNGKIVGFDLYTVVLEFNNNQTLIYKNNITSINISNTEAKKFKPINGNI